MSVVPAEDASAVFARYLVNTRFEDIPPSAVMATKLSIFDTLGVMLAGSGREAAASKVVEEVAAWGGVPESTVIGHGIRLPAVHAGFVNGAMAHQYDFDDTHKASVTHPTANSLPAALAIAERSATATGADLLRSVVLGSDVICRLGLAIDGAMHEFPWMRPAVLGTWGAAASSAVLLGMDEPAIQSAFGMSLHQACNTLECLYAPGSDIRGIRDGFTVRNGITAALLAHRGVRGDHTSLEGRHGLFHAFFGGRYDPARLTAALGTRFEAEDVVLKRWPSAIGTHANLECALQLRREHGIAPADIARIHLHVGEANIKLCEPAEKKSRPESRMDALSSLPFGVALCFTYGAAPLSAYTRDGMRDDAVRALARLVTCELDDELTRDGTVEGAAVAVHLKDGTVHRCALRPSAVQTAARPEAWLVDKIKGCARLGWNPMTDGQVEHLWDVVMSLEDRSVAELSEALGSPKLLKA